MSVAPIDLFGSTRPSCSTSVSPAGGARPLAEKARSGAAPRSRIPGVCTGRDPGRSLAPRSDRVPLIGCRRSTVAEHVVEGGELGHPAEDDAASTERDASVRELSRGRRSSRSREQIAGAQISRARLGELDRADSRELAFPPPRARRAVRRGASAIRDGDWHLERLAQLGYDGPPPSTGGSRSRRRRGRASRISRGNMDSDCSLVRWRSPPSARFHVRVAGRELDLVCMRGPLESEDDAPFFGRRLGPFLSRRRVGCLPGAVTSARRRLAARSIYVHFCMFGHRDFYSRVQLSLPGEGGRAHGRPTAAPLPSSTGARRHAHSTRSTNELLHSTRLGEGRREGDRHRPGGHDALQIDIAAKLGANRIRTRPHRPTRRPSAASRRKEPSRAGGAHNGRQIHSTTYFWAAIAALLHPVEDSPSSSSRYLGMPAVPGFRSMPWSKPAPAVAPQWALPFPEAASSSLPAVVQASRQCNKPQNEKFPFDVDELARAGRGLLPVGTSRGTNGPPGCRHRRVRMTNPRHRRVVPLQNSQDWGRRRDHLVECSAIGRRPRPPEEAGPTVHLPGTHALWVSGRRRSYPIRAVRGEPPSCPLWYSARTPRGFEQVAHLRQGTSYPAAKCKFEKTNQLDVCRKRLSIFDEHMYATRSTRARARAPTCDFSGSRRLNCRRDRFCRTLDIERHDDALFAARDTGSFRT